ncbi:MAG: hypothetical protein PWQ62_846 [Candidatus Methanomethylophilaceae archaeon]|nr:hypothetical protein [Candidatus Methanomethylophilaceae archaeon]
MRIRSVSVDRFAAIDGLKAEFPDGLVVITGDNESGKSSLMEFIRSGMFRAGNRKRYPLPSKEHRGSLVLEMDSGDIIHVERRGSNLRERDGRPLPSEIFHGMDIDTYESLFAIGLNELENGPLKKAEGRIIVDPGVRGIKEAMESLSKEMEEMMGKRTSTRSNKELEICYNEIQQLRESVEVLKKAKPEFEKIVSEKESLEKDEEELSKEIARIDRELRWLDALKSQRENCLTLQDLEKEIVNLKHVEDFPLHKLEDLEKINNERKLIDDRSRERKRKIQDFETLRSDLELNEDILSRAGEINSLANGLNTYMDDCKERASLETSIKSKKDELIRSMSELNNWSEEDFRNVDISRTFIQEAKAVEERLSSLNKELERLENDIKRIHEEIESTREDIKGLDSAELQEEIFDPRDLREQLKDAKNAIKIKERTGEAGRDPLIPLSILTAVLALSSATLFVFSETFIASLIAVGAVLTLSISIWRHRVWVKDEEHRTQIIQETDERLAKILPPHISADRSGLEIWEDEIWETARRYDDTQSRREKHNELMSEISKSEKKEEKLNNEILELKEKKSGEIEKWRQILRERRWPEVVEPDCVGDVVQIVKHVRGIMNSIKEFEEKNEEKKKRIKEFEERCSLLMTALAFEPKGPAEDVPQLNIRLEKARDTKNKNENYQERILELKSDEKADTEKLEELNNKRETLLSPYGGEEEFRRLANEASSLSDKKNRLEELKKSIRNAAGSDEAFEQMIQHIKNKSPIEIDEALSNFNEKKKELRDKRDELLRRIGKLKSSIDEMSADDKLARARDQLSDSEERMRSGIMRWATLALEYDILNKARDEFERERQPAVIQRAEEYLREMIGEDYRLVTETGESVVIEDEHSRRNEDMWSAGLSDQINLALRLALAKEMSSPEPLPLILDDVLARFDPKRRLGAAKVIAKVAEEQQVLFFTCNPNVTKTFRSVGPEATFLSMKKGRIKPTEGEELIT